MVVPRLRKAKRQTAIIVKLSKEDPYLKQVPTQAMRESFIRKKRKKNADPLKVNQPNYSGALNIFGKIDFHKEKLDRMQRKIRPKLPN